MVQSDEPAVMNTNFSPQNPDISDQELPLTKVTSGRTHKKLTLLPLVFLIYFEVAGGPYGEEPAVQAVGPLLALLGFLIFPFIWSVPEALITAELSTAYPGDGGFVIWAERAFGPFWGSMMGTWKFLSGVINIASFPILSIEYLKKVFPVFGSGWARYLTIELFILLLSILNYTGLTIVGYTAIALGVVSLLPFLVMSLVAVPQIHPHRWISLGQKGVKKDWNLYINTLFWNLKYWDFVSTIAGEVDRPQKTFPLALLLGVIFICLSYLIPLFAVTGAVSVDQRLWETGFMADAAQMIVGKWLKLCVEIGAVLSTIGLFEAQMSGCSFQVLGMVNIGFLPRFCAARSKWFNTPWVGILAATIIILGVSFMDLTDLISTANFLYSLGMLLEFASFLWLRRKRPQLKRPFKVPMELPGLVVMCLVPCALLVWMMVGATKRVFMLSGVITACGIIWFFFMKLCKSRKWCVFNNIQIQE
ncbi:probable polyamine transporter At3g13620 [Beta vulgaris subsp. vulgaris]|uniref:probable polyamine transporter At3g13620 n=1 Tax=Beta vulgaris subsp. vulgaris TaxID=3555 RepID=UPI0020372108|nr:probable polyamine transporter At3g13620 [Beta vulgaris subsp. vulgaris]